MTNTEFVSRVFHSIGSSIVKSFVTDLLVDMPAAIRELDKGNNAIVLSRKTGSDLISRFKFEGNESDEQAKNNCQKSLGWQVAVTMTPDHSVKVEVNDINQPERMDIHSLLYYLEELYRFKVEA